MSLLLQLSGIGLATLVLWRVFHVYFVRSPLDNIPGPNSPSILTGHFGELKSNNFWSFVDNITEKYGHVVKLQGLLGSKFLHISDHAALHTMFVKEPHGFEKAAKFLIGNSLLFGAGVASASGDAHRKQRKLLNPAFSPSHLRQITPVFLHVSDKLRSAIAEQVKAGPPQINVASWTARGALEIIGQGAMGYSFDALTDSASNDYTNAVRLLMPTVFSVFIHWLFTPLSIYLGPPNFRAWMMNFYPNAKVRHLKQIVDLLWDKAKMSLVKGDEGNDESISGGKDIMSIMLRENLIASEEDRLSDEQLIAQVNTFLFAASDTSANGLSRILHTLSHYPEVQEKLRQEIFNFRDSGHELTYDHRVELPYLDAIVRESLRVYPPTVSVDPVAQQDTVLPLSKPITDLRGQVIREIPITKGTNITINIHSLNRSKGIWGEDAAEWKPERWLAPLPGSAKNSPSGGVYHNLMTFLGGPRSCIGFKYAELEIKAFLFYLAEYFRFSPSGETIVWNNSFTVFPSILGETNGTMPLHVELVAPQGLAVS